MYLYTSSFYKPYITFKVIGQSYQPSDHHLASSLSRCIFRLRVSVGYRTRSALELIVNNVLLIYHTSITYVLYACTHHSIDFFDPLPSPPSLLQGYYLPTPASLQLNSTMVSITPLSPLHLKFSIQGHDSALLLHYYKVYPYPYLKQTKQWRFKRTPVSKWPGRPDRKERAVWYNAVRQTVSADQK
jgi:hypothetical protein